MTCNSKVRKVYISTIVGETLGGFGPFDLEGKVRLEGFGVERTSLTPP